MSGPHPTLEELLELGRTTAPDDESSEGIRHVRECLECQELYVAVRLLMEGQRQQRQARWRLFGALAASLLVVAIIGAGTWAWVDSEPPPLVVPALEPIPQAYLDLCFPDGPPDPADAYLHGLHSGIEDLIDGDCARAVETFERLYRDHEDHRSEIWAWRGLAQNLAGDPREAAGKLTIGARNPPQPFLERILVWHLAHAHLSQGNLEEAVEPLHRLQVDGTEDRYARMARDILRSMVEPARAWLRPDEPVEALATRETLHEGLVEFRFGLGIRASTAAFEAALRPAVEDLAAGDYEEARRVLRELLRSRPGDPELAGYLGMARYLAGDDSEEVRGLLEYGATDDINFVRHGSRWYLANLHLRRGEIDLAIEQLRHPDLNIGGIYARFARDLLTKVLSHPDRSTAQGMDSPVIEK